jgi:N-acetylglucosamine kinase
MYCGIDVGGTKMEWVAFDEGLAEMHRERVATPTGDFPAFLETVHQLVQAADRVLGVRSHVGLGVPGIRDGASGRHLCSNIPALNGQRLDEALMQRLGRPVALGNDCQCFALSESHGGAAEGAPSMFGVILGTGAGGGCCVGGRLIGGYNGLAGEWGHWSIPARMLALHDLPLLDCPCGLRGCLDRYVSGPGMGRLYRHLGGADAAGAPDAEAIAGRAEAGEALARRCMDIHLDLLAQGLASLVMALDPHAFVLGGGLSKLSRLYAELPAAMARHLFKGVQVPPILRPVFGDAGGARGAALLARQQRADGARGAR